MWSLGPSSRVRSWALTPDSKEKPSRKNPLAEKKKAYTTTTERKSFGELFWPQRKTFQTGGGYKKPMKTRKTISTTAIFPLCPPPFSAKKSSALEQGGVCFVFPSLGLGLACADCRKPGSGCCWCASKCAPGLTFAPWPLGENCRICCPQLPYHLWKNGTDSRNVCNIRGPHRKPTLRVKSLTLISEDPQTKGFTRGLRLNSSGVNHRAVVPGFALE